MFGSHGSPGHRIDIAGQCNNQTEDVFDASRLSGFAHCIRIYGCRIELLDRIPGSHMCLITVLLANPALMTPSEQLEVRYPSLHRSTGLSPPKMLAWIAIALKFQTS
jgi:hypothetical protein